MRVRIRLVQAVDIRKQHQKIGIHTHCNHCGKRVVIANLDLLGCDGIVFIDNGKHLQLQQTTHRILEITVAISMLKIRTCEKNLRHGVAVLLEQTVICIHQFALTNCRRRLLCGNILGTFIEKEFSNTHSDGSR